VSFLIGTTEKAAISAVTLGQSETACLDGFFQTQRDFSSLNNGVTVHDSSGAANKVYNMPVDSVQQAAGYHQLSTDGNVRNKMQRGESRQAALQRVGMRK
jgi:hypothetical protein